MDGYLVFFTTILAAGVASGTAVLFATIGEIFSERVGVLNLGVEGMMLMGAVTAFRVSHLTGNPWLGLLVGIVVGGIFSLLHAFVSITLRGDQVVSGLALTFVGTGLSSVIGWPLVDVRDAPRLPAFDIPLLSDIPVIGEILFQHNVVAYLGFLMIPVAWYVINRSRQGLHLRAVGEYPAAADALGVNVFRLRYFYVFVGGLLAGLAGASLSLAITPLWIDRLTAGQGWIAVGLVIFAQWDPARAAVGSFLFGAIRRLPLDLQGAPPLPGDFHLVLQDPLLGYFTNMLPYLFTIFVLVIASREAMRKRLGAPAALGLPYIRGERGA